ncbi:MAG TPA: DNA translocase FtsK, partial [Candidatus Babeliales bacterium]|nr:DNA translocase FtsK [Candidatus Babeliales bacterium]
RFSWLIGVRYLMRSTKVMLNIIIPNFFIPLIVVIYQVIKNFLFNLFNFFMSTIKYLMTKMGLLSLSQENFDLYKDSFWQEISLVPAKSFEYNRLNENGITQNIFSNTADDALNSNYQLPNLDAMHWHDSEKKGNIVRQKEDERAHLLEEKLLRFGVNGNIVSIKHGPVVTLYEYQPHIDTKISKIISLEDDLALALKAISIRIIAPIPGTSLVGFEVANSDRDLVSFSSIANSDAFKQVDFQLPLILGKDTIGEDFFIDLAKMPHLLIAGSTGSGKSMQLNVMLISLLCRLSPDQLRLVLIDPKRLEFAAYANISHLLVPIITDAKKAIEVLRFVVNTMEERYSIMAASGVKTLLEYHNLLREKNQTGLLDNMPYMVVVIDELADLMVTAGRDIEILIVRIAQMARAAGIHLIVATQRPSVDVVTGLIKVNFPSRISFRVVSKIDSRTILDCSGADKLLGCGDMLFLDAHSAYVERLHGAFIAHEDILTIVDYIRLQREASYIEIEDFSLLKKNSQLLHEDAELYQEVIKFLNTIDEISISLLQRKFRIGFNRSARIIELLESQGYVISCDGGKLRKVVKRDLTV